MRERDVGLFLVESEFFQKTWDGHTGHFAISFDSWISSAIYFASGFLALLCSEA